MAVPAAAKIWFLSTCHSILGCKYRLPSRGLEGGRWLFDNASTLAFNLIRLLDEQKHEYWPTFAQCPGLRIRAQPNRKSIQSSGAFSGSIFRAFATPVSFGYSPITHSDLLRPGSWPGND